MKFESANADDPEGLIKASQQAVLNALLDVVVDLKKAGKTPGLRWDDMIYLIEEFKKKEPRIIHQDFEL